MSRILTTVSTYLSVHGVEAQVCATVRSLCLVGLSTAKKGFIVVDLNSDSLNSGVFRNGKHPREHAAGSKTVLTSIIKTQNEIFGPRES